FQAEDGIRDFHVTGVQTCALPIFPAPTSCPARSGGTTLQDRVRSPPAAAGRTGAGRAAGCAVAWNLLATADQQAWNAIRGLRDYGRHVQFFTPGHGTTCTRAPDSALDHVYRQSAAAGFLVLVLHVVAGLAHGLDDLVEGDLVGPVAAHRHAAGVDRLDRAHGVALDAGDLHRPGDRVAGRAEVARHAGLGGVRERARGAANGRGQPCGGRRAGDGDVALAADRGAGEGGVLLVQDAHRGG